jgi:hypothetical protein
VVATGAGAAVDVDAIGDLVDPEQPTSVTAIMAASMTASSVVVGLRIPTSSPPPS